MVVLEKMALANPVGNATTHGRDKDDAAAISEA